MTRFGIGLICLVARLALAADGPDFQASFPKFEVNNPQIIWAAPTNQSRAALSIYKTVPQIFSGTVVSNLMVLGSFTTKDAQKWKGEVLPINTEPLMFVNKSNTCNLLIVPSEGRVEFFDNFAAANHWDKAKHLHEAVQGLPDLPNVEKLGLEFLEQFGIRRTDLAQKADGHLVTFGTEEKRSYFDRGQNKYIEGEVITRGIYFNRQLDGISFAGIGIGGGCEIVYGNRSKVSRIRLVWRNLQPQEQRKIASPDEIMQRIRDGQAVMTHKNLVNPAEVKKITITEMSLLYMGAAGDKPQDLVYPFAKLEAVVDLGNTNENVQLYCPILSTNLDSK